MHTSSSKAVHFFALYALYYLAIAFNAARDWSILRCMILRIIHLLMAPSVLIVSRFYEFSSAHIDILDCAPSPTLCALSSHHRLQCSSRLSTLRCMILRIIHLLMAPSMLLVSRSYEFSSAYINTFDCTPSDTLCALASFLLSNSMQLKFGSSCALSIYALSTSE